jgi:predicted branched-subunit amino acid permease
VLIWAAPAQVIMMTALAGGSALVEIAIAVALSGVRLLPMSVSLIPLLRAERTRTLDLILPAHFVAVTTWAEGLRLLPAIARENRVAFANGMGGGFTLVAASMTVAGYYLAGRLPVVLAAALLFLTPLSFLMSTAGNARSLADRIALALGLVIAPGLAAYEVGLDLLWSGVIGGTIGYAVQRWRRTAP